MTSYVYVIAPDTSQLRGGHRLRSGDLATVIRQVLAPQSWGWFLRPTRLVLALRHPFSFTVRQREYLYSKETSLLLILSPQLTAAAGNYAYVNLWLWEERTSPWRPAADVIIAFFSHADLPFLILSSRGHWRLRARLLNFFLLRLDRRWTSFPSYADARFTMDVRR